MTSTALTQATEDIAYSCKVTALDSDINDNLTWSVKSGTTLPSWLSLSSGQPSAATIATGFSEPAGVAIDAGGNVYVAEETGSTIHKIDSGNNNISSFVTVDSSQK